MENLSEDALPLIFSTPSLFSFNDNFFFKLQMIQGIILVTRYLFSSQLQSSSYLEFLFQNKISSFPENFPTYFLSIYILIHNTDRSRIDNYHWQSSYSYISIYQIEHNDTPNPEDKQHNHVASYVPRVWWFKTRCSYNMYYSSLYHCGGKRMGEQSPVTDVCSSE